MKLLWGKDTIVASLDGTNKFLKRLYFKLESKFIFQKLLGVFKCFLNIKCSIFSKKLVSNKGNAVLVVGVKRVDLIILKSCTRLR